MEDIGAALLFGLFTALGMFLGKRRLTSDAIEQITRHNELMITLLKDTQVRRATSHKHLRLYDDNTPRVCTCDEYNDTPTNTTEPLRSQ